MDLNQAVVLTHGAQKAVFLPNQGMTLASFTNHGIEALDPHSRVDFEHYRAGLGALIGPHFYLQKEEWILPVQNPSLFPHIAYTQQKGFKDPFSHGIGRYAPWQYKATQNTISATLSGHDLWHGISLKDLEGADFTMHVQAELKSDGLHFALDVTSSRVSLIGLHYYYALPSEKAVVTSHIQEQDNDMGVFKPLPKQWMKNNQLSFDLREGADYGFLPENGFSGEILLTTESHHLRVAYQGKQDEVSWQLYHPKGASFVCIEPMSVKNPRRLNTCSSSLHVQIAIFDENVSHSL